VSQASLRQSGALLQTHRPTPSNQVLSFSISLSHLFDALPGVGFHASSTKVLYLDAFYLKMYLNRGQRAKPRSLNLLTFGARAYF
jgi:hypothetical protein